VHQGTFKAKSMKQFIYIIGAGLGREIAAALSFTKLNEHFVIGGFIDDALPLGTMVNGIEVVGNQQWLMQQVPVMAVIAVGNPQIRKQLYEKLRQAGVVFPALSHPTAQIDSVKDIFIGEGAYIAAGCILTTNIKIGKSNLLLPAVSISHDTITGDFCTLMPGVRISSGAEIGNNVLIGTAAIISKPIYVIENTIIPPGAIVPRSTAYLPTKGTHAVISIIF